MTRRPTAQTSPGPELRPDTCREQILEILFEGRGPCEDRMEALLDRIERSASWAR